MGHTALQQMTALARLGGMKEGAAVTERTAMAAFAEEHGTSLLRFAYLLTGGRGAEAEDLVQTVLARMLERGVADLERPVAYARRAMVNEQHTSGRREQTRRLALPRLVVDEGAVTQDPGERLDVLAALRTLGEKERAAVVLRYWADLPDDEIAETLGCARATVRSLVHRALPRLREQLDLPTTDPAGDPS